MSTWGEFISSSTILDWSKKIDGDSIVSIPAASTAKRISSFSMLDSETYYNSDFNDQFGKGYGDLNLGLTGETDSVAVKFASTIYTGAPQILGERLTYKTENEPRILFVYNDRTFTNLNWGYDSVNGTVVTYSPCYSIFYKNKLTEIGDTDNLVLNFWITRNYGFDTAVNRTATTGNLYKKFYEGFDLSIVYDSVIMANIHLTARDIAEFRYSDLIYISDKQFGSVLCRVNNIVYNTDPTKLSTIELITTDPYNTINRDSQELILTEVNVLPKNEAEETEYQSTLN